MTGLRLYADACMLQYRALFLWASPFAYVSSKLLVPIFQVVFFIELGMWASGRQDPVYFAVGNAMQLTAINGIFGVVMALGNERQFGTLSIFLGSPANRLAIYVGHSLVHVVDGMGSVAVGLLTAALVYHLTPGPANLPLLALCVLLVSISTAGFGLALGSVSLVYRDILLVANAFYFLLLLLAGVNFPVGRLPAALQFVSYALPMTRGIQAARLAVAGEGLQDVAGLLAAELAVGICYALIGFTLFRWLENRARQQGIREGP